MQLELEPIPDPVWNVPGTQNTQSFTAAIPVPVWNVPAAQMSHAETRAIAAEYPPAGHDWQSDAQLPAESRVVPGGQTHVLPWTTKPGGQLHCRITTPSAPEPTALRTGTEL